MSCQPHHNKPHHNTEMKRALVRQRHQASLIERPSQALQEGWARVQVQLVGVCRTDVAAARGSLKVSEGRALGHEVVGVVMEVRGRGAEAWLGQRVGALPLRACGVCCGCLAVSEPREDADAHMSSPSHNSSLARADEEASARLPSVHKPASLGEAPLLRWLACDQPLHLGVEYDGAFSDELCLPLEELYPIPERLSPQRAAYIEPVAASLAPLKTLRALHQNGALNGPIGVWGAGRIAHLTARCLEAFGYPVSLCTNGSHPAHTFGCLIETTAGEEGLTPMLSVLRPRGALILKSRYTKGSNLSCSLLLRRELSLIGAHYATFSEAIELLSRERFVVEDLFGEVYALSDFEGAFAASESHKVFLQPQMLAL